MRKGELEEIAAIVIKHNLFVISDEIYSELTYGNEEHCSIASIDGMQERTIVINGFSKTYSIQAGALAMRLVLSLLFLR